MKQVKRSTLTLNRETVRTLRAADYGAVNGGLRTWNCTPYTPPPMSVEVCNNTQQNECTSLGNTLTALCTSF